MNEGKNSWDKIINLPNEYQVKPDLAENAIEKIKIDEESKRKQKRKPLCISLAASLAACFIGLAVFLPMYLSSAGSNEKLYYSSESITFSPIEDMSAFVSQSNLDIFYFNNGMSTNHGAFIIEDNKLAFINQNTVFIEDGYIEVVDTKIIVLNNVEYYFSAEYEGLPNSVRISDILVYYMIPEDSKQSCLVNFTQNEITYYMDIDTENHNVETIEKYVTLLIG